MQKTGPDSLRSWMAVLYCSMIGMLLYGVTWLSGILFVASMDKFQVDRRSASLPYILCDFLQAISGPLTGFLSFKYGVRQVMILGSFVAAIGTGTCFLAQNIQTITVLWGVVYGLGFGVSSLLLPVIITQNFVKNRATAISLVYVGTYVGFSFLPSIADLLIHTYGLSGTYLFLSGFLLHCVPLSMLLKNSETGQNQMKSRTERSRKTSISIISGYPPCDMKDSKCSINDSKCQVVRVKQTKFKISSSETEEKISNKLDFNIINQHKSNRRFSAELSNCGGLYNVVNLDTVQENNRENKNEGSVCDSTLKCEAKVKSDIIESLNDRKEIDFVGQLKKDALSTKTQSCLENFRNDDSTKSNQNHQCNTEFFKNFKHGTKFKCTEDQIEANTTPVLLNFKQIRYYPDINLSHISHKCGTENLCAKDDENRNSFSNTFIPMFGNRVRSSVTIDSENCFENPLKVNRKASGMMGNTLIRRASVLLTPEVTIFKSLKIFLEPIFLMVLFGNAVYSSSFIAFVTVIVDFTNDIGMSESSGKFVIMAFSIASNIGLLSFGWVTDYGFLSLTNFTALMFFLRTATMCAIPFSNSFEMLMIAVSLLGFFEASLANMFPLIVAEYYIDEIHELAISCTFFFCGPMHLVTPLLIGFFRDDLGSYLYLFLMMAATSLICGILHLIAPVLAEWRCGRDDWILRKK